jgi:CHASE1-domain containing sensor protein
MQMKEKIYNVLPYACLIFGLILTFLFYRNELLHHKHNQRKYFEDQAVRIRQEIRYRLQTYVDEQIAGAAFVSSSENVTRGEWRSFVEALKLDVNYPGINGLGFAVPVSKTDSLRFVREIQRDHAPGFRITGFGKTPGATDYFVIKFIEPQARNLKAVGFDMGSEPLRRAAMESARKTAKPVITERVVLVQDQNRMPAFLIYVPVFKSGNKFLGWSFAPFIARNFMNGFLFQELNKPDRPFEIELYDGAASDTSRLLFSSRTQNPEVSTNTYDVAFPVYGNTWTLRLFPINGFPGSRYLTLAYVILFAGILLSILLFFFLNALFNTRRNALELAGKMTGELRALNQSLDRKVAERTAELATKNKQLSHYAENLKNAYEDLEVKVKFRNLQLEKQVKALQEENLNLKNQNG